MMEFRKLGSMSAKPQSSIHPVLTPMLASLNRSAVLRFLWSFISIQSLQYWPALLRFSGIGEVNYLNHSPHWYCISSSIINKLIDFDCLRMWSCRMSWTTPRSSMASDSPSRGSTGFAFFPFLLCSRFRVHFVLFFLAFAMLIRSRTFFVEDLLKITARQVQAQGHGGLGEGFTGIAGRAVKVQTKLWIKEPRLISLATCNIMSFLVLWQILYQEQSTPITIPSDLFDIVVQDAG